MNKPKFQLQVMKAVIAIKLKQARKMKNGPLKKKMLMNINLAQKVLNVLAKKV